MKRILIVAEDAGGARALGPVITRLEKRGDEVALLLARVAAETLRADGVARVAPVEDVWAAEAAIEQALAAAPAVVVTASTCWGLRLEARAILAARRRRLPTATLMDFPSELLPRLSFPGADDQQAAGDLVLAIDMEMHRRLVAVGVPAARIAVTGSPAFDGLWDEELPSEREQPGPGYGLFVSQPIAALYGSDAQSPRFLGYTEQSVLAAVVPLICAYGLEVLVRPHPREDAFAVAAMVADLAGHVTIDSNRPLREAMRGAALVVGMTTIALVEAALLGKVAISVQPNRRGDDPLWTNASGLTVGVTDEEGLRKAVAEAVHRPLSPETVRARIAALGWAPDAAGRVVARLDTLAGW